MRAKLTCIAADKAAAHLFKVLFTRFTTFLIFLRCVVEATRTTKTTANSAETRPSAGLNPSTH